MLFNKERALEKMDKYQIDAIIASYPENVSYLSDFQSHRPYMYRFLNATSFALFPRRADIAPSLIVSTSDAVWAAEYPSWMEEVYTYGNSFYIKYDDASLSEPEARYIGLLEDSEKNAPSAGEAIAKALTKKGLSKGTIGLDKQHLDPAVCKQIESCLPDAKILDAFELIRVIRMVKTCEELERLTTVGLLNERATLSVIDLAGEGVSEEELTQNFLEKTAEEGAVFEFWNTRSGTRSSLLTMSQGHLHPPSRYRLKNGDMLRYDGGSIYNKYHSDAGGCAVIGTPNQRQKTCYSAIEKGMETAMEFLRPGVLPSKLFQEATLAVEKAGIRDYSRFANFCGHGIGLEARDYPIFAKPMKASSPFLPGSYDLPVEENMVISIELPYLELGLGGFQIEYTLLIKKDGCELLYPHKREMVVR